MSAASSAPFGFFRVGAACPRITVADPDANVAEILKTVEAARARGVQALVLPELSLTGYTCGDLFFNHALIDAAGRALGRLLQETASSRMVVLAGLPLGQDGRLFNAAVVLQSGRVLGVVPKSFLPGYREYYEERWFSSSRDALSREVELAGQRAPFGTDLLFPLEGEPHVTLGVEICEDLWAAIPPSSRHALAGASVLFNLSASNDLVGKAEYRRELVRQQSARTLAAYVYANAGVHESTTDTVFAGHLLIGENGVLLAEGERYKRGGDLITSDVDVEHLTTERQRQTSFADAAHPMGAAYRKITLQPVAAPKPHRLVRAIDPHPFVPQDPATLDERCREVFAIQTAGLAKRLEHTGMRRVLIGLSGGLDSTLALLVCLRTFDLLGFDRAGILAVTMPGFGTSERTLKSARDLAQAVKVALREIDIQAACAQHIKDIGLDPQDRSSTTFQNLQARERTQVLMDLANKEGGLVVGTGDLSEIALGFATFAGDHIAMYNLNCGVPKTLVRRLVAWVADHQASPPERDVLRAVLETPFSPELVAAGKDGKDRPSHNTEDIIGPYELHDFFLWCLVRLGAGPRKILFLARHAFGSRYDEAALEKWLRVFVERFFEHQFKRSVAPDGPKVGSVSLSPRADWRMPSDASKAAWLSELD